MTLRNVAILPTALLLAITGFADSAGSTESRAKDQAVDSAPQVAAREGEPAAAAPKSQFPATTLSVIADVIPVGTTQVSVKQIGGLIQMRPGQAFHQDAVDEDVRRLIASKLFARVEARLKPAEENRIVVYLVLKDHPTRIEEVVYLGAKHLKPEELEAVTGLHPGAELDPALKERACAAICRRYASMGRFLAGVDLVEGDKPGDKRVVFQITEGPLARVGSVDFTGNIFVSAARLREHVRMSLETELVGARFDPAASNRAITVVEKFYHSFGYHDVQVSYRLIWDSDQCAAQLVYDIQEGMRNKQVQE